ncbi:2-dehydropantoate 2-reductase [Malassezia sp. CBS 17886]|nr:2-dehydropantoate 2-reductase [Malassezia sp. CBS 17886]
MSAGARDAARPEVLLLGFGAVGALYGFILQRGGARVTAVCRSNYESVREHGIDVDSAKFGVHRGWRPDRVIHEPEQLGNTNIDYVVCTVKCVPDLRYNSETMRPYLEHSRAARPGRLPAVVLIQNGIDIEEEVYQSLVNVREPLASAVIGGLSWVGVTLLGEGTRIAHGAMERLCVGLYPMPDIAAPSAEVEASYKAFLCTLKQGGSDVEGSDDIEAVRWSKVLWNISWGGLSTMSRQPVSVLLRAEMLPYAVGVVRRLMLELISVARAHGITEARLPIAMVDTTFNFSLSSSPATFVSPADPSAQIPRHITDTLTDDFKPSILVDLERGRPMELEAIFGNLIKRARAYGVETPRLDLIVAALMPLQMEFIRRATHAPADGESSVYNPSPSKEATSGTPV